MPRADGRWVTRNHTYLVQEDGTVLMDGALLFRISPEGRITDQDGALVVTVQRDGHIVGPNGEKVGRVLTLGVSRPGQDWLWFSIEWDGIIEFRRKPDTLKTIGFWNGCREGLTTCVVVTHLILMGASISVHIGADSRVPAECGLNAPAGVV